MLGAGFIDEVTEVEQMCKSYQFEMSFQLSQTEHSFESKGSTTVEPHYRDRKSVV